MKPSELAVSDLMARDPTALSPRHYLARVSEEMELSRIRHVPIVDSGGHLVGLVTQRDLLREGSDLSRPVSAIMQTEVKSLPPEAPAREAAYLMLRHAIGCVPVVESDGRLLGIVTDTDFVRAAYSMMGGTALDDLEQEEHEADNI